MSVGGSGSGQTLEESLVIDCSYDVVQIDLHMTQRKCFEQQQRVDSFYLDECQAKRQNNDKSNGGYISNVPDMIMMVVMSHTSRRNGINLPFQRTQP